MLNIHSCQETIAIAANQSRVSSEKVPASLDCFAALAMTMPRSQSYLWDQDGAAGGLAGLEGGVGGGGFA